MALSKKKNEPEVLVNKALQASITPLGLEFKRNHMFLGEQLCRIYAVIAYPNEVDYGWYSRLTNIPGTIVQIGYSYMDNNEFINALGRTINLYRGIADSSKDPLEKQRKNKAADDAERIMRHIDQHNEIIGNFNTLIMVLSRDEDDFKEKCSRVESIVNTIGCKVRILSGMQNEAYMHISSTYPSQKEITEITNRPYLISTFVGGFPFSASGFCDEKGFYLGKNSDGGIILFDPWARTNSRVNSNITIIGTSGMGKSTAIKHLILSEFARGTKIIVIDPEGEYKEICLDPNVRGEWIDVAGGRGGMINPLEVRPAPKDDDEEESGVTDFEMHLKTLEVFFKLYIPSLTDQHIAVLNRCLIKTYANKGINFDGSLDKIRSTDYPTMSDLFATVGDELKSVDSHKKLYQDLNLLLESVAQGADKSLWNGISTISGKNNFVCLDTKKIMQMGKNIVSAQYYNILSWCWEQMSKNQHERVMLVADECWLMIDPNCPQSIEFLRNAEKRARKYDASIVVSTQNIIDFLDPAVKRYGQDIIDMPSVKMIFGFDAGKSLQEVTNIFSLNAAQHDLVASKQKGTALLKAGAVTTRVDFRFTEERLQMFGSGGGR